MNSNNPTFSELLELVIEILPESQVESFLDSLLHPFKINTADSNI